MPRPPYTLEHAHTSSIRPVLESLQVNASTGLSSKEAHKRLVAFGPNTLPRKRNGQNLFFNLLRSAGDPLILSFAFTALLLVLTDNIFAATALLSILIIDILLQLLQTQMGMRHNIQLERLSKIRSSVLRNKTTQQIYSEKLVVGDIIEIRAGDMVAADARLINAHGLQTNEGVLTGDSRRVHKSTASLSTRTPFENRRNMIYAGTTVLAGSGKAVVTATGTRTEYGKLFQLLRSTQITLPPFYASIQSIRKKIVLATLFLAFALASFYLFDPDGLHTTLEIIILVILSATPIALTILLTAAFAVTTRRMLRKGCIPQTPHVLESLGATTVLCTDKTGTLTQNSIKAQEFTFLQGSSIRDHVHTEEPFHELALHGLALANSAYKSKGANTYSGSPMETSALTFIERLNRNPEDMRSQWKMRDELSFTTEWKYRAVLVDHPTQSQQYLFLSGAPDVLLEKSSHTLNTNNQPVALTSHMRKNIATSLTILASQGNGLLAVAVRRHLNQSEITHEDVHSLIFLGVLVTHADTLPNIQHQIKQAQRANITVKLVTGENDIAARSIARRIGLPSSVDTSLIGEEIQEMSDTELQQALQYTTVFSKIQPLDKQRLVRLLQKRNSVVAITGNNTHDTVSLKHADIGIATQYSTTITKSAADLILSNNDFSNIIAALREGRVLRDNMRKILAFLLSINITLTIVLLAGLILNNTPPILLPHILWINIFIASVAGIGIAFEPAEANIMKRKPEQTTITSTLKNIEYHTLFSGITIAAGTLSLFWYLHDHLGQDAAYVQIAAFTFIALSSILAACSFRSLDKPLFSKNILKNPWLSVLTSIAFLIHISTLYTLEAQQLLGTIPLTFPDLTTIILLSFISLCLIETRKPLMHILWSHN